MAADGTRLKDAQDRVAADFRGDVVRGVGRAEHFGREQRAPGGAQLVEDVVMVLAVRIPLVRRAAERVVVEAVAVRDQPVEIDVGVFEAGVKGVDPVLFAEVAAEDVLAARAELAFERDELVVHFGDEVPLRAPGASTRKPVRSTIARISSARSCRFSRLSAWVL